MTRPVADLATFSSAATLTSEPWFKAALGADSLRYLANYFAIQSLVIALSIAAFYFLWEFSLPTRLYIGLLPLQCLITLVTFWVAFRWKAIGTSGYLFLLLLSVALLAWFLHDSGGHTNPLISLLLVPLAMSAALLGWQASSIIALVIVAVYAGLMQFYVPLVDDGMAGHHHHGGSQMAQLHLFGMWVTFCLSAILILVLVIPLAASLRQQREYIAQQREQALQDERLVAMATFAASAAHQLGTPLSTLSVIADDLKYEFKDNKAVQADIDLMADQVALCKTTLHSMMQRAEAIRNQEQEALSLHELVGRIREQFNLLNPARVLQVGSDIPAQCFIKSDETLEQAVLNLLDNSARAADADPVLTLEHVSARVCLRIHDSGPGISDVVLQKMGQPYNSTRDKGEGMGLGLFLSNSTINRLGGELKMYSTGQGTVTEVWLPLLMDQHSENS